MALNKTAMAAKVNTFVEAYNSMVSFITANSGHSGSWTNQTSCDDWGFCWREFASFHTATYGDLISSDYGTALSLSSSTQRTALSQLGVKTNSTGLLTFTSSTFESALGTYQTSVEKIFSNTDSSFTDSFRDLISDITNSTTGNIPTVKTKLSNGSGSIGVFARFS